MLLGQGSQLLGMYWIYDSADREEYKRCNDEGEHLRCLHKRAYLVEKTQGSSTVRNFGQADATVEGTSSVVLGELIAVTTSQ